MCPGSDPACTPSRCASLIGKCCARRQEQKLCLCAHIACHSNRTASPHGLARCLCHGQLIPWRMNTMFALARTALPPEVDVSVGTRIGMRSTGKLQVKQCQSTGRGSPALSWIGWRSSFRYHPLTGVCAVLEDGSRRLWAATPQPCSSARDVGKSGDVLKDQCMGASLPERVRGTLEYRGA
jgi:hypothetical protein